jgi:site-specific DNA-cytosine methylase
MQQLEDVGAAAAREAKRHATKAARAAERAARDEHAARMRNLRARQAVEAAAGPRPRRVLRLVQFAAGIAGALVACAMLVQQAAAFSDADVCSVFACDYDAGKLKMYDAAAAAMGFPPGVLADITDEAVMTSAMIATWAPLDLIVSSIPCTSLSSLGKRDGLKAKSVKAFIRALLRILSLAAAGIVILECTRGLETDARFESALLGPLKAMGYSVAWHTLDARRWIGAVRLRLFLVCFRSAEACTAMSFPSPPAAREVRLYRCLLPAYDPRAAPGTIMAPASAYFITRVQKQRLAEAITAANVAGRELTAKQRAKALAVCDRDLSIAARAVAQLPFVRGRQVSNVITFHFDRVTQIEHVYGVAPTLTKSGTYMLRDAYGVRAVTGGEAAALHGYPPAVVAALELVASSGQIVAAVGDGFAIPVVRDLIKAALRAVKAAAEGEGE